MSNQALVKIYLCRINNLTFEIKLRSRFKCLVYQPKGLPHGRGNRFRSIGARVNDLKDLVVQI